jgi:hypothetical protein
MVGTSNAAAKASTQSVIAIDTGQRYNRVGLAPYRTVCIFVDYPTPAVGEYADNTVPVKIVTNAGALVTLFPGDSLTIAFDSILCFDDLLFFDPTATNLAVLNVTEFYS